jgi:hypothetical protein
VTSDKLLAVQGVAPALDGLTVDAVRPPIPGIAHDFAPKELTLTQFRGEALWMSESAARDPGAGGRTRTAAAATRRPVGEHLLRRQPAVLREE